MRADGGCAPPLLRFGVCLGKLSTNRKVSPAYITFASAPLLQEIVVSPALLHQNGIPFIRVSQKAREARSDASPTLLRPPPSSHRSSPARVRTGLTHAPLLPAVVDLLPRSSW